MKTLNSVDLNEVNDTSKQILSAVKDSIGMIPNLYTAMGSSDKLLSGFLEFTNTLKSGEFTQKEYEVIALATSQANACNYCLSAHTTLAKMNGFSEDETLEIRSKSIADTKLNALTTLAFEMSATKGHPSEITTNNFFDAGYNRAAFAELIGIMALTTITNYVYHNGQFAIDFPKAQQLKEHIEI
jgi:uncharacterized peroxidase-related enzyme